MPLKKFPPEHHNYSSLSVRDLLEARDAYHIHLAHLSNVVATAVGRYRIHRDDWNATHPPGTKPKAGFHRPTGERTLANSVIRDWSWPCVLVFVREWLPMKDFVHGPDQMVPRALFLPDGRVIPTCVVKVEFATGPASREQSLSFPDSILGGGFAVLTEVQGQQHLGSAGCLVTNGANTYALTSQHVTGESGRVIYTLLAGERVPIGVSDGAFLRKAPFSKAYPGLGGEKVLSNLDVGMIKVDDASGWTSQIFGIGKLGSPVDLNPSSISLDLIGQRVQAFGAASGNIAGEIQALFYRYKSLGGIDYVADMLIGPQAGKPNDTLPGDSGTVWCLEDCTRPIAIQWGAHVFAESAETAQSYALATCLSTVCRELDVDIVRDHNADLPIYWGEVGHYSIGAKACQLLATTLLVSFPNLGTLMSANTARIGFKDSALSAADFQITGNFFPLADVPDKVFKSGPAGIRRGKEGPNHFADVDLPLPANPNKGKTLLQLCAQDPSRVNPAFWLDYYNRVNDGSKGLVPFRVQQLYQEMVLALKKPTPDVARFVAAAGIMAHYVGDACQPLHASFMHDGDPADLNPNGKSRSEGVHSAYETKMLNNRAAEIITLLNAELAKHVSGTVVASSQEAAELVVQLMAGVHALLPPVDLCTNFANNRSVQKLWEEFGDDTIQVIAMGVRTLAVLWASAWKQGKGETKVPASALTAVTKAKLKALYENRDFAPSVHLDEIGVILTANGTI
jgi:hypothetical protein